MRRLCLVAKLKALLYKDSSPPSRSFFLMPGTGAEKMALIVRFIKANRSTGDFAPQPPRWSFRPYVAQSLTFACCHVLRSTFSNGDADEGWTTGVAGNGGASRIWKGEVDG